MRNTISKGLTLVCFFGLIFSYVAFQSGWLGTDEHGTILFDPNGSVLKPNMSHSSDTLDPDSTVLDNLIIPSSKSGIIMPSSKSIIIDHSEKPKKKRFRLFKRKNKKKKQQHMGSSKSAIMFPPSSYDSILVDTVHDANNLKFEK